MSRIFSRASDKFGAVLSSAISGHYGLESRDLVYALQRIYLDYCSLMA